jgi:serine/threonine protein kinase
MFIDGYLARFQGRLYRVRLAKGPNLDGVDENQQLVAKSISRHPNHHPTFPLYSLRCLREYSAASSLQHENVIRTHDMVFDDLRGRYLVIMDYVSGGSLADWIKMDKEGCVARRLEMWKEAVEGVNHLVSEVNMRD